MNNKLSRRDFLKLAGLTSAGLALSACGVRAMDLTALRSTSTAAPFTATSLPTITQIPEHTLTPTPDPTETVASINGVSVNFKRIITDTFDRDLFSYWPMTEASGNAIDAGPHGYTASYTGGVTRQALALPDGNKIPYFDGTAKADFWTADFANKFNPNAGTLILLAKIDDNEWTDGTGRLAFQVRGGNDIISIQRGSSDYCMTAFRVANGDTRQAYFCPSGKNDVMLLGLTWDVSSNQFLLYSDGLISFATKAPNNWTSTPTGTYTHIGLDSVTSGLYHKGYIGHVALGAKAATPIQMRNLFTQLFPDTDNIFVCGDSKSTGAVGAWRGLVLQGLESMGGKRCVLNPTRFTIGGEDAGEMKAFIDANLAAQTAIPTKILLNIGANDAPQPTPHDEFFTEYPSIIDSMRAKWPGVPIYCARIWRRDFPANCATINKYINTIIASYGSGVYPGPDESIWMENSDNGATYAGTDGVHYNSAAQPVCAAQWLTAMGY